MNILRFAMLMILLTTSFLFAQNQEENAVLATYDGGQITQSQLNEKIANIPAMYQDRFHTTEGKKQILDGMCVENLFYLEAVELGLLSSDSLAEVVRTTQRPILVAAYRDRAFKVDIKLTDKEKRDFYAKEVDRLYTTKPTYTMDYIRVADDETATIVRKLFDEGGDFIDIMNQYSASEYARNRNGKITFMVKYDYYIPGIGKDSLLIADISRAEHNVVVGPVTTENGIHFYRVLDFTDGSVQTYEQAEKDIENRLRPLKESQYYYDSIDGLFATYGVKYNTELLEAVNLDDISANAAVTDSLLAWGNNPEIRCTVGQFISAFRRLPPQESAQYVDPTNREKLLHQQVEDTVFYLDALKKGYEKLPEIASQLDQARRSVYIREAYNQLVVQAATVSDEEVENTYNSNLADFTSKPTRTIQAFLFGDEQTANKMRKKIVKYVAKGQEDKIVAIVQEFSTLQKNDGVISNISNNGVIPGQGREAAFSEQVWNTPVGSVSEIFTTQKGEYGFARVMEEVPPQVAPLDQVSANIRKKLLQNKTYELFTEMNKTLEEKYHLVKYPQLLTTDYTAEELFTKAEDAQKKKKYTEAAMYYDQIISAYANGVDDYKALFMKAFLMAEDMKQTQEAIQLFQQLIDNYPEGDLHESAHFMIQSLTGAIDIMQQIEEDEAQQQN